MKTGYTMCVYILVTVVRPDVYTEGGGDDGAGLHAHEGEVRHQPPGRGLRALQVPVPAAHQGCGSGSVFTELLDLDKKF